MNAYNSVFLRYNFLLLLFLGFFIVKANAVTINFQGNNKEVLEILPDKSTGLDYIFVLYDMNNVVISTPLNGSSIEWYRFSNMGAGYAEQIEDISISGNNYILENPSGDMGYIINDGKNSTYFWIVDYSRHQFNVSSLLESSESSCNETILEIEGDASPIYYYTINGRREILSREMELTYTTLLWDNEALLYESVEETKSLASVENHNIVVTPPNYCNTRFILKGDVFLQEWGMDKTVESGIISPIGVEVQAIAEQEQFDNSEESNQINNMGSEGLGGSAPATINFYGFATDAVIHYEWQMSGDEDFNSIEYRINSQDFSYTFTEEGTIYIRFIGSNSDGSCENISDTFTVSIGASELLIPNAFSPNDDGINDIWKVSYRSLIEFECWIFDKHGHQIYHFEDPSGGWDGKKNGKFVKPGVYFYVLKAKGSDGKEYKKSGDINILTYKGQNNSGETME